MDRMDNNYELFREKTVSEMIRVELSPPVFLSAIGPSRDGVLIPSDFGLHSFQIKKRAASPSYQVDTICPSYQVDTTSPSYQVDITSPSYQVDTTSPSYQVDTTSPIIGRY